MLYSGYFNAVLSNAGAPITATITIYLAGTVTKATIYSTPSGTLKDNPFQTDVLGRFQFFVLPGYYDIEISGAGITTYKIENVTISGVGASDHRARAYLSADQLDLPSGAWTTINLNTEDYDIGGNFNPALYKFVVPLTGWYDIVGQVFFSSVVADKRYGAGVFKGAVQIIGKLEHASHVASFHALCHDVIYLTAADELYLKAYDDAGVNTVDVFSGQYGATFLTIRLVAI
jgi:hypothetical protein